MFDKKQLIILKDLVDVEINELEIAEEDENLAEAIDALEVISIKLGVAIEESKEGEN